MDYYPITKELPRSLPESPGVYIFLNQDCAPVYIGKAKNLKNRISSYFGVSLAEKTATMMRVAKFLSFIRVSSEIEALLLEARLVRKHMPKYNSELKDDKSPLYIAITKEQYPRVVCLRKTQLISLQLIFIAGPFIQTGSARSVMKSLRKIFHFSHHKPMKRVCIYRQIGLCYPCPSEIEAEQDQIKKKILKKQFQKNILQIKRFLNGNFVQIKKSILSEIKELSVAQDYEQAHSLKLQLNMIDHLTTKRIDPNEYIKDPNLIEDIRKMELDQLCSILSKFFDIKDISRIECFDIAHLAGTNPTASMVTFLNGEENKTYYRHFKVRHGSSDVDNIQEVLRRRLKHFQDPSTQAGWGKPDLIIVDGGKPQVSASLEVIKDIPLVGLAKQFETLVIKSNDKFIEIRLENGPAKNLVQRIRNEAHRFARRLHHKQIRNNLLK